MGSVTSMVSERRQQRRDRALLAKSCDADGFKRGLVGSTGNVGEDGLFEHHEIGHGSNLSVKGRWL
jgi:hypothetical protein